MGNYEEIRKKVRTTYIKLLLFSIVVFCAASCYEIYILRSVGEDGFSFGYMGLCSILTILLLFSFENILLIIIWKLTEDAERFPTVVFTAIGYIGIIIYLIKRGFYSDNIGIMILEIIMTIILFLVCVGVVFGAYTHIVTLQDIYIQSKKIEDFVSVYQRNKVTYNEKVDEYNEMNERIAEIGQIVSQKYKYKEIGNVEDAAIPYYFAGDIHFFYCNNVNQYFREIDEYQRNGKRIKKEMEEQRQYIDSAIEKKMKLLEEAERCAERIAGPNSTSKLNEIFRELTEPAFQSLKRRKGTEKKIKSIKEKGGIFTRWKMKLQK